MYNEVLKNKGLSIERLHLFCEVVRTGGIKAAVGDDPVRQSLASRQLKELSDYVGTELYVRNGRSLEMTEAGRTFAGIGNEFFRKLESFLRTTRDSSDEFMLGAGDSIFQWQILPKMQLFEEKFPKTRLLSYSYPTAQIIQQVKNRTLNAGVVRKSSVMQTDLACDIIGEIEYRLFIPHNLVKDTHKYGRMPSINKMSFCTLTGDGEYVKAMSSFLSAFNGVAVLNCSSMTQMYAAVQSGLYAAILPAKAENSLSPAIATAYKLPELTPFTRQIALIYIPDIINDVKQEKIISFLRNLID